MPEHPDVRRLRQEYARRAQQVDKTERYSLINPVQLFTIQQRQRAIIQSLRGNDLFPLTGKKILEPGCGAGSVLLECLSMAASAASLHGADLILDRLQLAHGTLANLPLTNADGQNLPYASQRFDLTMQLTVFSSILDEEVRIKLAREMMRVTRPGGLILWYDFWLNPTNRQTRGIQPAEIRRLFPNCSFEFHKITLAPPIARRIVPVSWMVAEGLEGMKVLNSHYLVAISQKSKVES